MNTDERELDSIPSVSICVRLWFLLLSLEP